MFSSCSLKTFPSEMNKEHCASHMPYLDLMKNRIPIHTFIQNLFIKTAAESHHYKSILGIDSIKKEKLYVLFGSMDHVSRLFVLDGIVCFE